MNIMVLIINKKIIHVYKFKCSYNYGKVFLNTIKAFKYINKNAYIS